MTISKIEAVFESDVKKVWNIIIAVDNYGWRSDLKATELINDMEFIEYTKDNFETKFKITRIEAYKLLEFDLENQNIEGHWVGKFFEEDGKTRVEFVENIKVKKIYMKPFIKSYLKKQQELFILDLNKALAL